MFLGQAALMAEGDTSTSPATNDQVAESALRKALAIDPSLVRAQVLLGTLYFNRAQVLQGADRLESTDWEQAVNEYQKAITLAAGSTSGQAGQAAQVTPLPGSGAGPAALSTGATQTPTEQQAALDRVWGPDGTPLFALGQAYKIEGDAYMQVEKYDEADKNYDTAIQDIARSRPVLAAGGERRLLGQADLSLAGAYWNKAVILRRTGKPAAEAKPLDDAARAASTECVRLGQQDQYDSVLKDRVIAAGCQPLLEKLTGAPG
jgi:tetratricopeptide (TPR) repeat protein